jgi:hypothetical protein
MSTTTAAQFARLKLEYPRWQLYGARARTWRLPPSWPLSGARDIGLRLSLSRSSPTSSTQPTGRGLVSKRSDVLDDDRLPRAGLPTGHRLEPPVHPADSNDPGHSPCMS